ncbi:hypothetical protein ACFOTA_17870 [Chitinophaga sp. GCM10012297]|uniref:Uncharacterized protein n=1 Tax=Chitinophaga chungangae TaxID=2821488 RepID=A0ABS3YI33_9BACT|nr:hypothetical protein [Chitinophaga chungangae]MBO9154090.1 hypothetical protein [Chitinophaga chungangae]
MAIQKTILQFTGKAGGMIGYRRGGKYCMRAAPTRVKQTAATKTASRLFGAASAAGRYIREAVIPALDIPYDTTVVNRLNALLYKAAIDRPSWKDLSSLEGFSFSQYTRLQKVLGAQPVVRRDFHGNLLVTVASPGKVLKRPPQATHLAIKAIALNAARDRQAAASEPFLVSLAYPQQEAVLTVPYAAKDAAAVIVEVIFVTEENGVYYPIRNRRYYAAEVIAAVEAVAPKNKRTAGRPGMKKLHNVPPAEAGRKSRYPPG